MTSLSVVSLWPGRRCAACFSDSCRSWAARQDNVLVGGVKQITAFSKQKHEIMMSEQRHPQQTDDERSAAMANPGSAIMAPTH